MFSKYNFSFRISASLSCDHTPKEIKECIFCVSLADIIQMLWYQITNLVNKTVAKVAKEIKYFTCEQQKAK
jgi:hypothetical protein